MRSIRNWNWPRPRFRTASLLLLVAWIALGLGAWKAYWSPNRIWRRAIHQPDQIGRGNAWGSAMSGRIAGLGRKETIEEVAATLEDTDDEAAASAVEVYPFVERDAPTAASRLALRLLDGQPSIRRRAASSLRLTVRPDGSGREQAVPPLIAALDDPDAGVRRQAALTLAEIGYRVGHSPSISPEKALRSRLDDAAPSVRIAAALALARSGGGEEAIPMLAGAVQGHRDENCPMVDCTLAFEALMVLAVRSDRAASALIEGVYREDRGQSAETLTALAAVVVDDRRAKARMIARAKALRTDASPERRLSAALALARIDEHRDAVPGLVEALDRGTEGAKDCAGAALRRIALFEPEAVRAAMDDPSLAQGTRKTLRSLVPDRSIP